AALLADGNRVAGADPDEAVPARWQGCRSGREVVLLEQSGRKPRDESGDRPREVASRRAGSHDVDVRVAAPGGDQNPAAVPARLRLLLILTPEDVDVAPPRGRRARVARPGPAGREDERCARRQLIERNIDGGVEV